MSGDEFDAAALKAKMWSDEGVKETRRIVVVLMKSDVTEIVIDWLHERYDGQPGFAVDDHGPYYRVDAEEHLEIDLDEIEPLIGRPYNVFDFLVNVSTTIGRAYTEGNTFALTTTLLGLEQDVPRG